MELAIRVTYMVHIPLISASSTSVDHRGRLVLVVLFGFHLDQQGIVVIGFVDLLLLLSVSLTAVPDFPQAVLPVLVTLHDVILDVVLLA